MTGQGTAGSGSQNICWFPKNFGPGDIDGTGARKLLGTPSVSLPEVLVREMAQNSWDARLGTEDLNFGMNLRKLETDAMAFLRDEVFASGGETLGLDRLLELDEMWVLEISDRGTTGLDGPVRNDLSIAPEAPTNFIDLVFHVGAPRDTELGGGTYGFGKTIAYITSSVGTVLIWSQCQTRDGTEQRFIGSALGEAFDMDGVRYTGRHWWGRRSRDGKRVEPLINQGAQRVAERIFAKGFDASETGTSILILAPKLLSQGAEDVQSLPKESVQSLVQAVLWNLWPKLLEDQANRTRMRISVELEGVAQDIPAVESHPTLSGFAECLLAVRKAEKGEGRHVSKFPVHLDEIWCLKPKKLLGFLALTRYPAESRHSRSHEVAYMRSEAELVVKYASLKELDAAGFQWAGVFKPTETCDDSFAAAEPPAHDDWIAASVQDPKQRRDVSVALRRVREKAEEFITPTDDVVPSAGEDQASVAHIGDMLADLVYVGGATQAGEISPKEGGRGGRSGKKAKAGNRARATVRGTHMEFGSRLGWIRVELVIEMGGVADEGACVDVQLRVGIDGGSIEDHAAISPLGWLGRRSQAPALRQQPFLANDVAVYVYEARSDVAVDVVIKVIEG